MSERIYTVSEINAHIKMLIESDRALGDIYVSGELSNYKMYPSGHHYFTLKDGEGTLRCVMFSREASKLKFRPESGMKVIIRGRVAVYPRDGAYQLYANEMTPDGVGALFIAYEQLKKKLEAKGYFDPSRKKPLPKYPRKICLVTSSAGAAVRDMLRILGKRWPSAEVIIVPVRVQGEEAPGEIAEALDYVNACVPCDLIITGRGGGSIEDLWAFNDERVADAIFRSKLPVVSAVGHEPDFTISDFVADLRAATPSNAAELTTPDRAELSIQLANWMIRLRTLTERRIKLERSRLEALRQKPVFAGPEGTLRERRQRLLMAEAALASGAQSYVATRRAELSRLAAKLDALSPLAVLTRGYAIASGTDGSAIRSVKSVAPGDRVKLRFADGSADALIVDGDAEAPKKAKQVKQKAAEESPEQLEIL